MSRPRVITHANADTYADKTTERIIEFTDGTAGGPGGLISFRRQADGRLSVSLYRLDEPIDVIVDPTFVKTDNIPHGALAAWWRNLTDEERALTGIDTSNDAEAPTIEPGSTRVTEVLGTSGRWQAQYFDAGMRTWFDIGDSTDNVSAANDKADAYRNGTF